MSGLAVNGPANGNFDGSQIHVTTKDLVMNLHSEDNYVYGVYAMNASTNRRDDNSNMLEGAKETATVVINAENTIINATAGTVIDPKYKEHRAIGIVAMSEGEVEINGNLFVNADTAVLARGKAVVNINKDKKADTIVQLNGDINFNYQKETSGTPVRAVMNINGRYHRSAQRRHQLQLSEGNERYARSSRDEHQSYERSVLPQGQHRHERAKHESVRNFVSMG